MGYNLLLIFLGGGLGSVLRYLIGKYTIQYYSGSFPAGTFIANTLSCILIGAILYLYLSKEIVINKPITFLLITGFCGGLSTFSTFSFETFELLKQGFYSTAILNVVLSVIVGLIAIFIIYKSSFES